MINAIQSILNRILTDHPPKNLLCIGRGTDDAIKEYLAQQPQCQMVIIDVAALGVSKVMEQLEKQSVFDFAIVANSIEHLDSASAEHLLARLRDIQTKKLLLVVPIGTQWENHASYWEETDLLALGFILKANITVNKKPLHIYAFDIATYKTTPDWLNNKYWANPELWDRFWW
ncbi:DUF6231 family protein [Kaarinaea lacus]